MIEPTTIASIVSTIAERFHPQRIILFGSQARGDARVDSDLDLCVVMDSSARPLRRIVDVRSAVQEPRWAMDILVYTPDEYEQRRGQSGSLVSAIEAEGTVLYDARS